jgi:hypothetical protein
LMTDADHPGSASTTAIKHCIAILVIGFPSFISGSGGLDFQRPPDRRMLK